MTQIVNHSTGEITDSLTEADRFSLEQNEDIIAAGLKTFVDVGRALADIRGARLYRETHDSFEAYCDQRWNLSRPRAYQLIDAAATVGALSTNVDTPLPKNEGQARELRGLDPEPAAEAMRTAHETTGGKVTAKDIRVAVTNLIEKQADGFVDTFPILRFYVERNRHDEAVRIGRDLVAMTAHERTGRMAILEKSIAAQLRSERGEAHPEPHSTIDAAGNVVPIAQVFRNEHLTQTPSPAPRGEAEPGEGQTSRETPSDNRGVEADVTASEVQSERVERPIRAPRPTVTAEVLRRLHDFAARVDAGQYVSSLVVRGLADDLHDFADALEVHDAQ